MDHPIGCITVQEDMMIWALEGGRLGVNVDRVFDPNDPQGNQWNTWISPKLQGPAYVKDSTETKGAWMDRVLLVRPD